MKAAEQCESRCESVIGVLTDVTYEASIATAMTGRKLEAEAIGGSERVGG